MKSNLLNPISKNLFKRRGSYKIEINSGNIFRNMLVLATGGGLGKVIGILTLPVITRIYSPEHMGVLSVFVAFTALLVPVGTLRYSAAIPLPKNDKLAVNLAVATGFLSIITSSAVAVTLWISAPVILELFDMMAILPYWWLLPVAMLTVSLYETFFNWSLRKKEFRQLAFSKVFQSIMGAVVKISLGLWGLKSVGLLFGQIAMQFGGVVVLAFSMRIALRASQRWISRKRILFLLAYYSDFPKYRLASQFLLVFSSQAPLLFTAWIYDSETTGQLGLALTTLALPMALFGQSIGQAYYAEIAKIGKGNRYLIYKITKDITLKLFLISLPAFLILLITGPFLFKVVFGAQWKDAGIFASILAIYLLAQFVSSPLVNVLNVFNRQKMFLRINITRTLLVTAIYIGAYILSISIRQILVVYSIVLVVHYIFVSLLIFRVINEKSE